MPEDPALAPFVPAFDALLLEAKLSVPQARPGAVSRSRLIETARASGCWVVGVTAPAGYGKTTLLAEWARAEDDRPVAWVSLDRFDDDPAALLAMLASPLTPGSRPAHADLVAEHVRSWPIGPGTGSARAWPQCSGRAQIRSS